MFDFDDKWVLNQTDSSQFYCNHEKSNLMIKGINDQYELTCVLTVETKYNHKIKYGFTIFWVRIIVIKFQTNSLIVLCFCCCKCHNNITKQLVIHDETLKYVDDIW